MNVYKNSGNKTYPAKGVVGTLANDDLQDRTTQPYLNGDVYEKGCVAVFVVGEVRQFSLISQGCTPFGMVVYLRTDGSDYFAQMRAMFGANTAYQPKETPAALSELATIFERHSPAQGVATLSYVYL